MNFITVFNKVITGVHCGQPSLFLPQSSFFGHEIIEIPENNNIQVGDLIDFYDNNWIRKSYARLVEQGLKTIPEGWTLDGDDIRQMTDEELILCGKKEVPSGYKIENGEIRQMTEVELITAGLLEMPEKSKIENGVIVSMSFEEQYEAGLVTEEQYNETIGQQNQTELARRLTELNTPENQAQAIIDDDFAASWKARITALLAVKQQSGWPLTVSWPQ